MSWVLAHTHTAQLAPAASPPAAPRTSSSKCAQEVAEADLAFEDIVGRPHELVSDLASRLGLADKVPARQETRTCSSRRHRCCCGAAAGGGAAAGRAGGRLAAAWGKRCGERPATQSKQGCRSWRLSYLLAHCRVLLQGMCAGASSPFFATHGRRASTGCCAKGCVCKLPELLVQVDVGRVVAALNSLPVPTDWVDPVTQASCPGMPGPSTEMNRLQRPPRFTLIDTLVRRAHRALPCGAVAQAVASCPGAPSSVRERPRSGAFISCSPHAQSTRAALPIPCLLCCCRCGPGESQSPRLGTAQ